ncbi:hypothetical protein K3495_g3413 [Podosphaera aphanis]|nr:hypothetical protein K3495_g3413 [Podosphaera aphanis]
MTGSVLLRAVKLYDLLAIKTGPLAARLPPNITRLHLIFPQTHYDGNIARHKGAIKFWRQFLPQLKYHNPTVSMTVERLTEESCPCHMTIHYNSSTTPSTSEKIPAKEKKAKASGVKTKEINMKGQTASQIIEQLLEVTKAKLVELSAKDAEKIEWVKQAKEKSLAEAQIMKVHNEKRKKQEEMMSAAKGVTA